IRRSRRVQVFGLTWPLLTKTDGTKFGKSESGSIWLDPRRTSPYAFYQYWYRTDDADVGRFLRLLTFLDQAEILALEDQTSNRPQERAAQRALARALTTSVHGEPETVRAESAARSLFEGNFASLDADMLALVFAEAPCSDIPGSSLSPPGLSLVELLVSSGLAASRTAARTAITQGAAWLNGTRQTDVDRRLTSADLLVDACIVLRRGKRDYHLVRVT
ncbi:MAG: tyrosine--tRNA ligase, partial [Pseudonocardiaceae bacterium]